MDRLERLYNKMHQAVQESRKKREQNEEELINFLEKVIEKVRREMLRI